MKDLKEAFELEKKLGEKGYFSDMSGTWTVNETNEFEASIEDFSQIDKEMWK